MLPKSVTTLLIALICPLVLSQGTSGDGPRAAPPGAADLSASDWAAIRDAYEAHRHAVQSVLAGHRAENPGQRWHTLFDGRGSTTRPEEGAWIWGLELRGYGFAGGERPVTAPATVSAQGTRVAYRWSADLTEWYVNGGRGLEHGFTVHRRPPRPQGARELLISLAVRGDLRPEVEESGRGARFVDDDGSPVVTYRGLEAFDAAGRALPATLERVTGGLRVRVDARGARYPLTIDPVAQQAYLKASNTDAGDAFGSGVAVDGDTVVVGARGEASSATGVNGDHTDNSAPSAGAAYVFVRDGTTWSQQAYLKASNTDQSDMFGEFLAVSGDTVAVGAYQEDSSAAGIDGDQTDNGAQNSGAVYVFVRNGTDWSQQAYIKSSNPDLGDAFGFNVALSGDTLAVGAQGEASQATGVDGDQTDNSAFVAGAVYVFVRNGTTWSQQAYLKASNTDPVDQFHRVALSGDTLLVGAYGEDSSAVGVGGDQADDSSSLAGAAYVFVRNGTDWSQQAYLKASNTDPGDQFGRAVALSGDTAVVGARGEQSYASGVNGDETINFLGNAGAAYVFVRNGTTWSQQAYLKASNPGSLDSFGWSVGASGDTVVVGAPGESSDATGIDGDQFNEHAQYSGAAYVFRRTGSSWSQQAYVKASNTDIDDQFAHVLALDSETLVVGTINEDSHAEGVDGAQADNSADDAGAAYVFDLGVNPWSDLGGGTIGGNGPPTLVGSGSLVGGKTASVSLSNAPTSAAMVAWISFAPAPFAALGGTVWAYPFASQLFAFANASGGFGGSATWPGGIPAGTEVSFQFIVQDLSVPDGLTLSNGLKATTP